MTTRQVNPNSRRFLRQAIRSITQGRMFGRGRRNARTVQASTTSASAVSLGTAFTHHDITTDASGLARVVTLGSARLCGSLRGQAAPTRSRWTQRA
jgi:hypothetical protein